MHRHPRSTGARGQTYDNDRYGSSARGRGQTYEDGHILGSDSYAGDDPSDAGDSRDDRRRDRRDNRDSDPLPILTCEYGSGSDEVPLRGMRRAHEPPHAGRRPSPTRAGRRADATIADSHEAERRQMSLDREVRLGPGGRDVEDRRYARHQQESRGMAARSTDLILHDVPSDYQSEHELRGSSHGIDLRRDSRDPRGYDRRRTGRGADYDDGEELEPGHRGGRRL